MRRTPADRCRLTESRPGGDGGSHAPERLRGDREVDAFRQKFEEVDEEMPSVADDQLRLIFTCCHPALSAESQVALTPHRPRLRVSRFHRRLLGDGGGIRGPGRAVRRGAAARASAVRTRARGARGVGPVGPDVPAGQPA
ncbi:hypothetical protein GS506_16155 [Rhodococcus hoagii]|nr:hypothetical protein [Prescottella equi]